MFGNRKPAWLRRSHRGPAQNQLKGRERQETRYETEVEDRNVASCRYQLTGRARLGRLVSTTHSAFFQPHWQPTAASYSFTRK
jgi:hypothetical protein